MDQFINLIKINNKINNNRIAYCGRLDPMARGQVLILAGDECMGVSEYNKKNKIYQVKIIFGISTDSDDALGIIDKINKDYNIKDFNKELFIYKNHKFMQKYHYYSTKMLNHRRKNNFNEYSHEVKIYESKIISEIYKIDYKTWKDDIIKNISSIDKTKNFRQTEIINQWNSLDFDNLNCIDLELSVSSGFFVRQFVRDMISILNIPIMCYDIHRVSYF